MKMVRKPGFRTLKIPSKQESVHILPYISSVPSPRLTAKAHLKNDAWKTTFFLLGWPSFRGKPLVSGISPTSNNTKQFLFTQFVVVKNTPQKRNLDNKSKKLLADFLLAWNTLGPFFSCQSSLSEFVLFSLGGLVHGSDGLWDSWAVRCDKNNL